ncbi:MAG: hypothetical protein ACW98U_03110 [Candidatus Thorarchaeota archaeon]
MISRSSWKQRLLALTQRKRTIFQEPIVRAKVTRVRFPKTCPVCAAPASKYARISTAPRRKVWLRPHWDPRFSVRRNKQLENDVGKSFIVDVCQDHEMSDNAELKLRGLSTLIASIIAGVSIFALIYAGSDYWAGRPVSPWVYSYIVILSLSLILGYVAFRPSALEASIKIIGFDFERQHVWLRLKNREYLEQLMSDNPMTVELVNWVVKV